MMGSVADRQQALRAAMPVWEPRTLHAVLDDTVRATPDRPCVITDDRSWSYAEIAAWSKRLAAGLVALGVAPGEKVALVLANYPEFVAIRYAVSRIGAVCVPINILNRCDELRYLLDQSDSVLLVTMDRFRGVDYLDMLDQIAPGWEDSGGGEGLPNLRHVAVLPTGEAPDRGAARMLYSLEAGGGCAEITVDPHAVCDIIYTSGTTGPPKGVLLTHDMLMRTAYGSAYARAFEDGRRILFSLPMYHVFGYVEGLLAVPFVGGAIVPQLRFDAIATLAAIARHHATDALLIPAMSLAVLDAAGEGTYDLSRWNAVLASGGRAPERLWQGLREGLGVDEITTGYGMTETTASTTVTRPDDPVERLLTTNGRQRDVGVAGDPRQGGRLVTYRVVDPGTGAVLDDGETGELVASGYGVTQGYYNKPEATAAAFDAEGWLRTGDLGRIDDDGYITLLGRTKESYRCGGEQVLPTEIEDLLTTHADVVQAHVVPIPDERMGEVGVAFVVARPGATLDRSALQTMIAARLARYKVPRHILLVDAAAIPTTASGRARKFLLTKQALQILELP
ncbi:Acyl--CoA ligase [Sphingomonas sp. T1]|uniref:AMP-binding protein n=1 Tax=Sphingomonas sp. T1 TaxID=2653172 RepID=UPI0012F3AA15|nr:AMP-binding protein [Sphingomonas sp. T1]VXD02209.1 Acyl--CoA ligase [Sphingomonas sp. T1]